MRHIDREATRRWRNDGAPAPSPTPAGGGDLRVELQHGEEAGEVRRGSIVDEGDRGWELTEDGVGGDVFL
jgi:hypothetical protein